MPKQPTFSIEIGTQADLAKYGDAKLVYIGTLPAGTSIAGRAPGGGFYATHPDRPVQLVDLDGIRPLAKDGLDV